MENLCDMLRRHCC